MCHITRRNVTRQIHAIPSKYYCKKQTLIRGDWIFFECVRLSTIFFHFLRSCSYFELIFVPQNKIVLEVNCGTAILSLLIGSQGAKRVIGIEPSRLAESARQSVRRNGLCEKVHIIQSNVRNIRSLPFEIEKVDVIVSQWMGYLFFDDTLLDPLIEARQRWLKSDGIMFPDTISLHIAAAEYGHKKTEVYKASHVHGFDFAALIDPKLELPTIEIVPVQKVDTECHMSFICPGG